MPEQTDVPQALIDTYKQCPEFNLTKSLGETEMDLYESQNRLQETQQLAKEAQQLAKEAQQLAEIDTLTGVPNKLGFERRMHQAIEHARRAREPLSIAYADADELKHVNDSISHAAGNELLQDLAKCLKLRETDIVCRIGGDEFVIILVGADTDAKGKDNTTVGANLAARLRQKAKLREPQNTPIQFSIGFSSLKPDETLESLLNRAEVAMYADKTQRKQNPELHLRS